jgi:inorganic pyrophosphatase
MTIKEINPGSRLPAEVNVIIEIPAQSDPVKYEVDKQTGTLLVDRFMGTSMRYPCNYGYIPKTLSEDGDPVDVLVITPFPLFSSSVITVRPIGLLDMVDEAGSDSKLLAVPIDTVTPIYQHVKKPEDIAPTQLNSILHFFEHYKDLEMGKWVKIKGWLGYSAACTEIINSVQRYKKTISHDQ